MTTGRVRNATECPTSAYLTGLVRRGSREASPCHPNRPVCPMRLRPPQSRNPACWFSCAAGFAMAAACLACSKSDPQPSAVPAATTAAAAPSTSASAAWDPCTTPEQVQKQPCRAGQRQFDQLPTGDGPEIWLTHCPLDDCGSGGCAYDVYGQPGGCLRRIGTIHGAWIDVAAPSDGHPTRLRTWGRSGSTHVATEYDMASGRLVPVRKFVCEYGGGRPLPSECPKL
jgi:hypothetical protein